MMLFLIFNVVNNPVAAAHRARKCSVPFLPPDKSRKFTTLLHPKAGRYFNVFHKIGQGYGWMQIRQDVDVVLHSVDTVEPAISVFDYTGYVFVQLFAVSFCDGRLPVFGTEYDVVIDLAVAAHRQ